MTVLAPKVGQEQPVATQRRFLMCPPRWFDVVYAINPWMHPEVPVDRSRAMAQWESIVTVYESLGHRVDLVEPSPGCPDMVFAANSALSLRRRVLGARFRHHQRRGEAPAFCSWFERNGFAAVAASPFLNEGEGDFAWTGSLLLAGHGFRTSPAAHRHASRFFGVDVVSLRLVDPRYYHLDTALAVLGDGEVMYFPGAFSEPSRRRLRALFPGALLADAEEAAVFAMNATSDGRHVVLPAGGNRLVDRLRDRGYEPIEVDVSELLKAGGGVKCCTLELRS